MTVTIVSLAPYVTSRVHRQEGDYEIPAKKKGEPYAKLVVRDGRAFRDFGDKNRVWDTVPARAIAEDLVRDCADHGVFIAEGEEPTDEELREAARKLRQEAYPRWIEEADSIFARTGDRKEISLHARIAARELNLRRDWALDLSELAPCVGCNTLVPAGTAKCAACGAILNWDKARSLGLVTPEQYEFAVQRGQAIPMPQTMTVEAPRRRGRPPKFTTEAGLNG